MALQAIVINDELETENDTDYGSIPFGTDTEHETDVVILYPVKQ